MKRYLHIVFSCATAAVIGLSASAVSAQRAGGGGRGSQPAASATGETVTSIGTVHIGRAVKADGQPLPAGTYQLRVTERQASPDAPGQTPEFERWAEFLQGGQAKGREVVTVVTADAAKTVLKEKFPASGSCRTDVLKGGDYYRLWCNRGGTHYLVHFNIG